MAHKKNLYLYLATPHVNNNLKILAEKKHRNIKFTFQVEVGGLFIASWIRIP